MVEKINICFYRGRMKKCGKMLKISEIKSIQGTFYLQIFLEV